MTRKNFLHASICALAITIASGAQGADVNYDQYGDYAKYGAAADVPGACSYQAIDQKDYSGRTLKVISHAVPVIGEPTDLHARQFEALTGAKVDVVHIPFGDLYQRIMIPFQTQQAAYDVLFYPSLWIGDLHGFLAPVPAAYKEVSGMKDVTQNYKDVATWGEEMVQYPVDGDRHYLKYRSDIFDDPDMQAKYKTETGKDLKVPATWEEYNAVAKFFSGWDWAGDGQPHFGSAEVTKRDDLMFSAFISRVAAYAKNPNVKGGFFFDLETMEPQVNNPGWVKALEMFIDAQKAFPPGGANFGLGDEIFSFGGGQALMSYSWTTPSSRRRKRTARSATRSQPPASGRQRSLEPHDEELGQVRDAEHTALHHLGLDIGSHEGLEEPGHGFRLSLLLLQRGKHHARSPDRPLRGEPLPHDPFRSEVLAGQARMGAKGGGNLRQDAERHGR